MAGQGILKISDSDVIGDYCTLKVFQNTKAVKKFFSFA